jgi:hypothetical protein
VCAREDLDITVKLHASWKTGQEAGTYVTASVIPIWAAGGGIGLLLIAGLGLFFYFCD